MMIGRTYKKSINQDCKKYGGVSVDAACNAGNGSV